MKIGIFATAALFSTQALSLDAQLDVGTGVKSEVTGQPSILGIDTSSDFDLKFDFETAGEDSKPTDLHEFADDKDSKPSDLHQFAEDKTAVSSETKSAAAVDAKVKADAAANVEVAPTASPAPAPTKE